MKKLWILLGMVLCITGCSNANLSSGDIDSIVDTMIKRNTNIKNSNFDGYSYYIPKGLTFISKDAYNATLKDKDNNYFYLYVDVVSYYHQVKKNYKVDKNAFYSKKIKYKDSFGYLEINEDANGYFVEGMYHYMKVEAFVNKNSLRDALTNIGAMLSSVKYNKNVLSTTIGENILDYKEETYDIFNTKKKTDDFLDYVKEYEKIEEEEIDEDNLKVEEGE